MSTNRPIPKRKCRRRRQIAASSVQAWTDILDETYINNGLGRSPVYKNLFFGPEPLPSSYTDSFGRAVVPAYHKHLSQWCTTTLTLTVGLHLGTVYDLHFQRRHFPLRPLELRLRRNTHAYVPTLGVFASFAIFRRFSSPVGRYQQCTCLPATSVFSRLLI